MRVSSGWEDYRLLDAGDGERLERFGDVTLIRPDPQVIWPSGRKNPLWEKAHARYIRSDTGGGHWEMHAPVPDVWSIRYGALTFRLGLMGFKHTGVFPEQAVNWDLLACVAGSAGRPLKVLNLFGYTGAATLALAAAGAAVTHVDASKGMVAWGKENAQASGLSAAPIRWLTDDCAKFVARELRRGSRYDGILLDPPSYGRGPGGEIWKFEEQIFPLLRQVTDLLTDDARFVMVSSYTAGFAPSAVGYMLELLLREHGGQVVADEIGVPVEDTGLILPCGATAVWQSRG